MIQNLHIRSVILLFALSLARTLYAQSESVLCFAIVDKDGVETYFAVSEEPSLAYTDGGFFTLTCRDYVVEDIPLGQIEKQYFTTATPTVSGITSLSSDEGTPSLSAGKAYVTGLHPNAVVALYTISGQCVASVAASHDGSACIDFSRLNSGTVYVLRTPTMSYKIVNK